jgi:hypothetical protein
MAGALKGLGDHALVLWAGAGAGMVQDFGVRGHKAAQGLRVLIVHGRHFIAAEIALFFDQGFPVSAVSGVV